MRSISGKVFTIKKKKNHGKILNVFVPLISVCWILSYKQRFMLPCAQKKAVPIFVTQKQYNSTTHYSTISLSKWQSKCLPKIEMNPCKYQNHFHCSEQYIISQKPNSHQIPQSSISWSVITNCPINIKARNHTTNNQTPLFWLFTFLESNELVIVCYDLMNQTYLHENSLGTAITPVQSWTNH